MNDPAPAKISESEHQNDRTIHMMIREDPLRTMKLLNAFARRRDSHTLSRDGRFAGTSNSRHLGS